MTAPAGWAITTIAELQAIDATVRSTGFALLVTDQKAWYVFIESLTTTADGVNIVAPTSGTGRWFKTEANSTIAANSINNSMIATDANIAISKIASLSTTLASKSDVGHNHTSANISDLTEVMQDMLATFLVAGSNITFSYNDASNTYTINSISNESIQDLIASFLTAGTNLSLDYDDVLNTLVINATVSSEVIDDRVASFLVAGTNMTFTYDDTGNTLTLDAASGGGGGVTNWDDIDVDAWDGLYN